MKKFFLGFIALLVSATLFAAPRTVEEAAEIAAQFTNNQPQLRKAHKTPRAAANMRLAHKALQNNSEKAAFYVFNQENTQGFVIVSADDRTADEVLGYTENGSFDANNINPNLQFWLNRYAEEITVLQTIDDSEFIDEPKARKAQQVTAIAPLLKNKAGKEPYYTVVNSESLLYISQKCAISLKKLCKYNNIPDTEKLKRGRKLKLKK